MAEGDQKPVVQPPPPYAPTKYFLSSLNTFLGQHLVARLRNDHIHPDNPNRILGTQLADQKAYPIPAGVRKVIDGGKVKFMEDIILNSDVIIYDLTQCDLKEAESVISTLKIHPFQDQKTLICISNVMTWARSHPKEKKEGDEEQGDQNPPEEPDSEQEGAAEGGDGEEGQKKVYVRFTDKDFSLRKPAPEYERIKSIETLCLAAGKVKPNLKTYVVCSGLLYGEGQTFLSEYFMQARLQIPQALPVYGKGKNRIPTVHVADLITYIQKVIQKKPDLPYLLAIDHNPKPTQRKIIESISQGIGTGRVQSIEPDQANPFIGELTLNLRIKPSSIFMKIEEEEAAIEVEEGSEVVKFKFDWHSKDGIQKSIELLRQEFNKVNKLSQQKIFVMGPPGSGKTYHTKELAEKYYLPRIHIKNVIEQVCALKNQFGEEVKNFLTEKKETLVQEKQAEYQQRKQKWKKLPKAQRDPLEPFDPESVDVRLSDELVYKCYKWRLTQNDCLNRGYILDGYPRTYQDAAQIFMGVPVVQGEDSPDENAKKVVQERLVPNKLIILEMSNEAILERIQNLPEEQVADTHLSERRIHELLKRYRSANNADSGEFIVEDFFKENKINCHHVAVGLQTDAILESLVKPLAAQEKKERELVQMRLVAEKERRIAARLEQDKKEKITRDIQNQDYMMKKENEQNEEREILDKTSLALRKYLDVNLVPILSEGIVQLLSKFPQDPVDTLAEFLFKNSLRVPNPDPSTFDP